MKLVLQQQCRGIKAKGILKRQQLLDDRISLVGMCIRESANADGLGAWRVLQSL